MCGVSDITRRLADRSCRHAVLRDGVAEAQLQQVPKDKPDPKAKEAKMEEPERTSHELWTDGYGHGV
jgi:hypothetical protein